MSSYSSTFSSPLGAMHNSHPSNSTSILSLFKSSITKSSSSSSKSEGKKTASASKLSVDILPSTSSTYTSDPPTYYQAIGKEENLSFGNEKKEGQKDYESRRKEQKRAAKELKLREADARMDKEFSKLGF